MHCRNCGYSLLNLTEPRCPECGTPFDVTTYTFVPGKVRFACPHCGHLYDGDDDRGLPAFTRRECAGCRQTIEASALRVIPVDNTDPDVVAAGVGLPWESDEEPRTFRRWWETCKLGMFHPTDYYARIRYADTQDRAYGFLIRSAHYGVWLLAMILLVCNLVPVLADVVHRSLGIAWIPGAIVQFVVGVEIVSLSVYVGFVSLGWFAHLAARLVIEDPGHLSGTVNAVGYASCPVVVIAVPVLGPWVFWIWSFLLALRGIRTIHHTTPERAFAVCAIAYAVLSLPYVLFALAATLFALGPFLDVVF